MRAATVVQVSQDLFCVLLRVLLYLWSLLNVKRANASLQSSDAVEFSERVDACRLPRCYQGGREVRAGWDEVGSCWVQSPVRPGRRGWAAAVGRARWSDGGLAEDWHCAGCPSPPGRPGHPWRRLASWPGARRTPVHRCRRRDSPGLRRYHRHGTPPANHRRNKR